MKSINCKGNLIEFNSPKVMGVLNLSDTSFYDGGKYKSDKQILKRAEALINEEADFIDIGAVSSNPNSSFIEEDEEIKLLIPTLDLILKEFPDSIISIDTFRGSVADECLIRGAAIINDISGFRWDANLLNIIKKHQAVYICMHSKGNFESMHQEYEYHDEGTVVNEVFKYFTDKISQLVNYEINDIVIDPGFGFSKNQNQNFELLSNLDLFSNLELPILVGISRKSMIHKLLKINPSEAGNGTACLNTISILKGADILRVHDVKQAKECIKLIEQLKNK